MLTWKFHEGPFFADLVYVTNRNRSAMNIAFLSPGWPPAELPNGIVTYTAIMREQLIALGHSVSVFSFNINPGQKDQGIHSIERHGRQSMARLLWLRIAERLSPGYELYKGVPKDILRAVRSVIKKNKIDIFVMEESFGYCATLSQNLSIPIVVVLHGPRFICRRESAEFSDKDAMRIQKEGIGLQHAAGILSPSQYTLGKTNDFYGLSDKISAVIPNPVAANLFSNQWSLDNCNRKNILFVGRFDYLKGADIALRVFERLIETHPDITLTFVGPDRGLVSHDKKKYYQDEYVLKFLSPVARSRINFMGFVKPQVLAKLRLQSFTTICCSRYETFPFSLLEALSAGCPVVATSVGGIPEIVQDGRNGLLGESEDIEGLASKVRHLLDNPDYAAALGRQGREDCLAKYDASKIARQNLEFYDEVLRSVGGR